MKYWEVRMAANSDDTGELILYGDISSAQWWGDEITPKQVDADLKALGDIKTLNIYVNSGGGSVFAGQAIYNIIKRHKAGTKNAYIDGLAASIASVIPLAADKVYMPNNAMMMVHNPYAISMGNAGELRKMADTLDTIRESILNVYEEKTGQERDKLVELMDAETWMTADDALEYGFVDELQEDKQVAASIDGDFLIINGIKVDTKAFKTIPETYRAGLEPLEPVANREPEPQNQEPEPSKPDLAEQAKEFARLRAKIYDYKEDK